LDDYFLGLEGGGRQHSLPALPTFIKMDIEGAELAALHGAERVIKQAHPKLAICVYHKIEDIYTIPQYLQSLGYTNFALRNYLDINADIILYAW